MISQHTSRGGFCQRRPDFGIFPLDRKEKRVYDSCIHFIHIKEAIGMSRRNQWLGYFFVILSAVIFGRWAQTSFTRRA